MRKTERSTRSMTYLLSVDRSLRRVSLRKISVRVKNAKNRLRSDSPTNDAARKTTRARDAVAGGSPSLRAGALALIVIFAAATLIGVPGLFQRSDPGIASVEAATSATQEAPPAPPLDTTKAPQAHVPTAAAAPTRTAGTSAAMSTRVVESPHTAAVGPVQYVDAIPNANAIRHASPRLPADSSSIPKLAAPAGSTASAKPTPHADPLTSADIVNDEAVTISGCLQTGDDSFWLRDTSGANAPKSRSWKSGFLKKHAESVHVIAASRVLQLSNYVAQRVTVTGTLANRTMQVRSLERVAGSCH